MIRRTRGKGVRQKTSLSTEEILVRTVTTVNLEIQNIYHYHLNSFNVSLYWEILNSNAGILQTIEGTNTINFPAVFSSKYCLFFSVHSFMTDLAGNWCRPANTLVAKRLCNSDIKANV